MKFEVYYMANPAHAVWKTAIVEQFKAHFSSDWKLHFVDVDDADTAPAAWFANHLKCMRLGLEHDSYVLIAEPGVAFLPRTEPHIRRCVNNMVAKPWDMIYTEVTFPDAAQVARIFRPEQEMLQANDIQIHYLRSVSFIGSSCYFINKWSKHKVEALLSSDVPNDSVYSEFLRSCTEAGTLSSCVLYPFATKQLLPVGTVAPKIDQPVRTSGQECSFVFVDSPQKMNEDILARYVG